MGIEIELHPIQKDILLVLIFKPKVRFSKLNNNKVASDQFNFHLKRLIFFKLVEKTENSYSLTQKGKEFANRLDTENKNIEKQAKLSVLICCVSKSNDATKYLVQQRLKEPYGDGIIPQGLEDKIGDDTAIIRMHVRSIRIEDAGHLYFGSMLAVIIEEEGFGTSFSFVITGAGSNAVDIPPVILRLGMGGGISVNF